MKILARFCLLCLAGLCLSACLVPDKYLANLSVSNNGYSLEFIGKMHMAASFSNTYKQGAESPRQLAEAIIKEFERVIRERPQSKIETQLLSEHSFATKFSYISPYAYPEATGMFIFNIEGDTLTVTSRPISSKDMEFLKETKLSSEGTLCIKAFGTVLETNAEKSATLLNRCNEWKLKDLEHPIKLVVRFSKPIPMTMEDLTPTK